MTFSIRPIIECDYPGCLSSQAVIDPPDPDGVLTLSSAYRDGWRRTVVNPDEGNSGGRDYCPEHADTEPGGHDGE